MYRKAIKINLKLTKTYYNLACLMSLSHKEENKPEAFENLKLAIELDSEFRESAKTETDFDFIRDDPRFVEIVGGDEEI